LSNLWGAIAALIFGFAALIISVQQLLAYHYFSGAVGFIIAIGFFILTVWAIGGDD